LRLSNAQKIANQAGANVQRKLAKDWNDLGAAAKAIQGKAKQAIPLAPRERLALAGAGGSIPEQSAAGASAAATKKKLQEMMQKMDNLNVKGSGESGIIKEASRLDGKVIRDYVKDIESRTGRELNKSQLEKIKEALRNKEYTKLSPNETKIHRRKFDSIKDTLIDEWEIQTGQKWPRYSEDLISEKTGKILRRKGDPYDAHHIIENSFGGEHEWWNMHPAKFPNEHQAGIHGAGSPASELFK
ncbi:HNH endonuclease signature motif containing protein, partial [Listeria welshimeri]